MFREMRRKKQEVSREECLEILRTEKRGVLAMIGDEGYPYAIPVDYYYSDEDGHIYIHCAKEGHKIDAIRNCSKVCFTVWNQGFQKDGDWAWNVTSIVMFGKAALVDDRAKTEYYVRRLGCKFYPTAEEVEVEIEQAIDRVQLLEIEIEHMTGKLVNEK